MRLRFVDTRLHSLDPEYYFHRQDVDGNFGIAHIPNDGSYLWRRDGGSASDPYSAYCLPDHPGGSAAVRHAMQPFISRNDTWPPPAHVLRFWTSTSYLAIDPKLTEDKWYGSSHYKISDPHSCRPITQIDLDPSWRSQQPDNYIGEFIVISIGCIPPSDYPDDEPRPAPLSVMLIERAEEAAEIAFRVQLCSKYIPLDAWRSTGPKWKLVNLA